MPRSEAPQCAWNAAAIDAAALPAPSTSAGRRGKPSSAGGKHTAGAAASTLVRNACSSTERRSANLSGNGQPPPLAAPTSRRRAASCPRGTRGTRRRPSRCRRCCRRRRTARSPRACRRRPRSRTPCWPRWPPRRGACRPRTRGSRTRRAGRSRRSCRRSSSTLGIERRRFGTDVEDHLVARRRRERFSTRPFAPASRLVATTTSIEQRNLRLAELAAQQLRREVEHVLLVQRLADVDAGRRENRVCDAAAQDQLVDLRRQRLQHLDLGRDLRAGDDRRSAGASGSRAPRPTPRARRRAAARARDGAWRATPFVLACARCAVPNASMTNTSQSAAIRFERPSSSASSPTLKRTFSQQHELAGRNVDAVEPFRGERAPLRPSSSPSFAATGASDAAGSGLPSFGLPEVRHDHARARRRRARACNVGNAASMRAVLVTLPSLTGTFRSSRISTRFPCSASIRHADDFERHAQAPATWPPRRPASCRACGSRSPTRCRTTSRP